MLREAHRLELVSLPEPSPRQGEVLVRVAACGVCGSDLSSYKAGLFLDSVPGHEVSGVVEEVGPGVDGWRPGDQVTILPLSPCGDCRDCRAGQPHRCPMALAGSEQTIDPGGLAELVRAPVGRLFRVPAGLAVEDACLAEPLAVVLHGLSRAGVNPGEPVIVVGLGSLGLLAVAALQALGAGPVLGLDPVPERRALALKLGAERVMESARQARGELEEAPLVLECSGSPEALMPATELCSGGGRVLLLGIPVSEVPVVTIFWVTKELTLVGSIKTGERDFEAALDLLARKPAIAQVITDRVPLAQASAIFERMLRPLGLGKVVVDPQR